MTDTIEKLTAKFIADIEAVMLPKLRAAVAAGMLASIDDIDLNDGIATPRRKATKTKPARRKGPIQLCPVPKCKNRAAPVFGMVCSKHAKVPKKTIAKYRAARRAKKGKG